MKKAFLLVAALGFAAPLAAHAQDDNQNRPGQFDDRGGPQGDHGPQGDRGMQGGEHRDGDRRDGDRGQNDQSGEHHHKHHKDDNNN